MIDKTAISIAKSKLTEIMDSDVVFQILLQKGYLPSDAQIAIEEAMSQIKSEHKQKILKGRLGIVSLEFFDRVGFGLSSVQYTNIFFFLFGINLFLIGLIHGINLFFQLIISFFFEGKRRMKNKTLSLLTKFIGILFLLAMGIFSITENKIGILSSFLFYSAFILIYSIKYNKVSYLLLKNENRGFFTRNIALTGLIFTAIGIFFSAWILDYFPFSESLFGKVQIFQFSINSPAIIYFTSALMLFIAGIIMFFFKSKSEEDEPFQRIDFGMRISLAIKTVKEICMDKKLMILSLGSIISFIANILINAYLGIFIYTSLSNTGFGAFRNVSIIFIIALFSSMLGPYIVRSNSRLIGKLPLLIFGTLLSAILPFAVYFNRGLMSLAIATLLGILGSSIAESAFGMAFMDMISNEKRVAYFRSSSLIVSLPSIILVAIGAFIAQSFGIQILFISLSILLALVVVPMYLALLIIESTRKIVI